MPEPTATNPQTGEKLVFRGGQWTPLTSAPAAPVAAPQAAAPVAPQQSRPPAFIPGTPRPAPAPTELQLGDQARQDAKEERSRLAWEATHNPDGTPKTDVGAGTVDERKIATLLTRIAGGANDIQSIAQTDPEAQAPGLVESLRGDLMPGGIGGVVTRSVAGADRRSVHDAQRDVLDALLTLGTGAAYNSEQLSGQMASYFPQYGESAEESEVKTQRLLRLIAAAKTNAGPAWARVEPAIAPFMQALAAPKAPGASGAQPDNPWPGVIGEDGKPLPPEGGYGKDPETGEWSLHFRVTDESPAPPTGDLGPDGKPRITGNDPGYMQVAAGFGDIAEGLGDTIGLVGNPLNQTVNWLAGTNLSTDLGQTLRKDALGLPYGNETIGAINQAVTGAVTGAGAARAVGGGLASGTARNALLEYGANPMMDVATGASAAASGEGAKALGGGPVVQTLATIAGGGVPSMAGLGRNALAGRRPPPDFNPGVVAAGERQNIPIRRPDAAPSMRGEMANAAQTPHGGPMISQARNADQAAVEQRVEAVGGEGNPSDPFTLGSRVQGAGTRYIARTRAQANRLYQRAEGLAGDTRVTPTRAIAEVDRQVAELEAQGANTNASLISYLKGLKDDLTGNGLSITEFQGLRSGASKKIKGDQALTVTDADRRLGMVMREFTADAGEQLPEAAASALEGADQFYSQRQDFINGVLRNVMGTRGQPLPAERAAERLVAMTKGKGDQERFASMWGELEPEEQADLAATIAASLGRKANGDFSLSTLVGSLDPRKGINPRTARLVFGNDGAAALADLRTIANAKTATQQGMNNSNTGAPLTRSVGGLKTLVLGALGYSAGGPVGAVAGGLSRDLFSRLGEQRAARLLLNPDFTKWLRNAPDTASPQAINAYFGRLQSAAKGSIYAGDVRAFQDALAETFSQSPMKAAAADQEQNRRPEPPQ